MNPIQVNKNKNPLLSCAITGGFDEFTGSGIVLAAAGELRGTKKVNFGESKGKVLKMFSMFQPCLLSVYCFLLFLLFCTHSNINCESSPEQT